MYIISLFGGKTVPLPDKDYQCVLQQIDEGKKKHILIRNELITVSSISCIQPLTRYRQALFSEGKWLCQRGTPHLTTAKCDCEKSLPKVVPSDRDFMLGAEDNKQLETSEKRTGLNIPPELKEKLHKIAQSKTF